MYRSNYINVRNFVVLISLSLFVGVTPVSAQSTAFTYQGRLTDNNQPANGIYDFEFKLFDALTGGTQDGTARQVLNVAVTNGTFTVLVDFGAGAFPGADRFLEIGVRPAGSQTFTLLTPRQQITVTPYALFSGSTGFSAFAINATNAINSTNAENAETAQTAQNALQLGGIPLSGFIRNTTTLQTSSNFNISGSGTVGGTLTAGSINVIGQYNADGNRLLVSLGQNNLYLGILAGSANGGIQNTLVGDSAGKDNTGNENALFGFVAGQRSTGSNNSFFGSRAGASNTTGSNNTIIGFRANVGPNNLTNATAIGNRALVESSNALVLGSVNGKNEATADTRVGIGTTSPGAPLELEREVNSITGSLPALWVTSYGAQSIIASRSAGGTRSDPTATLDNDELLTIKADGFIGNQFTGDGKGKILIRATENWNSTGTGAAMDFYTTPNNTTSPVQQVVITNDGNVGIGRGIFVTRKLDVNGDVRVGTGTNGCVEDRDGTVIAGACSSDLRLKRNITPFGNVLNSFLKLRPVDFYWRKDEFADKHFGDKRSFGLIAQEVEEVFPELVSTDQQGYKVVNYSKLPLLTIQAVKELKAENDTLKQQVEEQKRQVAFQQKQLDALRKLVCQNNPQAEVCK